MDCHRILVFIHIDNSIGIILCTRYTRITQTVIKYVLIPDLFTAFCSVLAQLTDNGFALQHFLIAFVNHCSLSSLFY